jgi:hypothetical protein
MVDHIVEHLAATGVDYIFVAGLGEQPLSRHQRAQRLAERRETQRPKTFECEQIRAPAALTLPGIQSKECRHSHQIELHHTAASQPACVTAGGSPQCQTPNTSPSPQSAGDLYIGNTYGPFFAYNNHR